MHSTASKREGALDTVEESIRETLEAQKEYLAAWDAHWRERVASSFASLTNDKGDAAVRPLHPDVITATPEA